MDKKIKLEQVAQINDSGFLESSGRIYSVDGLSPTIKTMSGGNLEPKILEEKNLKTQMCNRLIAECKIKENDVIRHSYSTKRMNGEMKDIQENNMCPTPDTRSDCLGVCVNEPLALDEQNNYIRKDGCVGALTTDGSSPKHNNRVVEPNATAEKQNYRIRKLTPKECGRLMCIKDKDIDNIAKNQSQSSQYHLYGDSICCFPLMAIFGEMFETDWKEKVDKFYDGINE